VDLAPLEPLPQPVTLAAIKAERSLAKIRLVTHSRLSVMPIEADAFERILSLASKAAKRPRSEPQASEGGPPQGWRPRRK
jgi:predicted RNA-binding protein with PUA-like domain